MFRRLRARLGPPSASVIASFEAGIDDALEEAIDETIEDDFPAEAVSESLEEDERSFPAPRVRHHSGPASGAFQRDTYEPFTLTSPPGPERIILLLGDAGAADDAYTYRLRYMTDRKGRLVPQTMHCGSTDAVLLDRFDRRGTLLPGYKFAFTKQLVVLVGRERNEKGRAVAVGEGKRSSGVGEKGA